ncbi:energy transducer TonB [Psychrobacter submarinus]|uniref:energy transducer TonB n=1 Tax=Psychrobacter submarinus TaxID=154108 RepID=UPI00191ADB10|nr:energy transducer TonB [Psychrobacter submarinus]
MTERTNKKSFPTLYTGTFIAVIALHAITGWALANVKTPDVTIAEPNEVSPLEIEMITPIIKKPEVVEVQPTPEPVIESKPKPVATVAPQPKPEPQVKPEPKVEPKPKAKPEPKTKPDIKPKPEPRPPVKTQQTQQEVQAKKAAEQALAEKQQQAIINAQKQAERQAQENAKKQEQERINAQELAKQQEIARQQALARQQAENERLAQAEKTREAAAERARAAQKAAQAKAEAAAANSEPVSFSDSDASWAREPNFEGLTHEALTLNLRFRVDKQGNISNITVTGSNDRRIIREAKRRLGRSKLNPFIQNGVPVTGIVNLSIAVIS